MIKEKDKLLSKLAIEAIRNDRIKLDLKYAKFSNEIKLPDSFEYGYYNENGDYFLKSAKKPSDRDEYEEYWENLLYFKWLFD